MLGKVLYLGVLEDPDLLDQANLVDIYAMMIFSIPLKLLHPKPHAMVLLTLKAQPI